jgi:tetratricopeptide (TPR) repeat protein
MRRGLALDPDNIDVLRMAGLVFGYSGNREQAAQYIRRLLELDPLSSLGFQDLGETLSYLGRFEESLPALRRALELSPRRTSTHAKLAYSLMGLGRLEEALEEASQDSHEVFRLLGRSSVLWLMGRREESDRELEGLIERWSVAAAWQVAILHMQRRDVDSAFAWIDRGIETRDSGVMEVRSFPWSAVLQGDPRWPALMKRLHFED